MQNALHLRFRTVPFCHSTKEGQSLESFTQITIYLYDKFNKKYANGAMNIMLSILSNIPPCPGIRFPKSFIPTVLFMVEADKSPIWLRMLSNPVINPIYKYEIDSPPNLFIQNVYIKEINIAPNVPPYTSFYRFFRTYFTEFMSSKFRSNEICTCISSPCSN